MSSIRQKKEYKVFLANETNESIHSQLANETRPMTLQEFHWRANTYQIWPMTEYQFSLVNIMYEIHT